MTLLVHLTPAKNIRSRYMPNAHGRPPCACPICNPRGAYGAAKIRKAFDEV